MARAPKRCVVAALLAGAALGLAPAAVQAADETAVGEGGAAATVDRKATKAAIRVLERGGNAADAAVAAAGVLGVTEPFSSGIGGGGFMVVREPGGDVKTIDGRETAPAAMNPQSFFENGQPLGFADARYSGLSAGTPGTVATWDEALRRFGTYSLATALAGGERVARRGFKVDETFRAQTAGNTDYFDDIPSTAAIYLTKSGNPKPVGSKLRNPDMARAYRRISARGPAGFYQGRIARAMVRAAQDPPVADDANHVWRPGLLERGDLSSYEALRRDPTRISYRGLEVWGMGPPSSGGSTVGEILNILEGYEPLGATEAQAYHRFLEASRYAFADRGAYLADPAFFDVPLAGLLSDDFAAERRALITDQAADAGPVEPGDPTDDGGAGREVAVDTEGKSTTHLTVADDGGMVVSYTFTIESTGGNGIVVPGWGFLLNNELTDFTYSNPDAPNAPEGGKRPRSSMAPTIVTKANGKPLLAVGSPGGSTIITTVAQILIERLDLGSTLPEAIAVPRASQRNTATTTAEPTFIGSALGLELASVYGHEFVPPDPPEIGAAAGIELLKGGRFQAAAEPERRGSGSAMVVEPD